MMADDFRNPDGTWKEGCCPNPAGKGGNQKGWQPYGNRVAHLIEKYSTDEILAIAEDKKLLRKQSAIDAIAIVHIARALEKTHTQTSSGSDDVRGERKELLDRIEGTPKNTTQLQNPDGTGISPVINIVGVEPNANEG